MNALIVDDERLARSELRRLLAVHPDVTVVAEAASQDEAEARLRTSDVDVMFLDIQMPGGSGFDLLERLGTLPLVISTIGLAIQTTLVSGRSDSRDGSTKMLALSELP